MAKDQNQTQQTEEQNADVVETKEEDTSIDKAVKTNEDFDKKLDAEGVEETPSEDDDKTKDSKESEDKDKSEADDKGTGEGEAQDSDKDDDTDADKSKTDDETKVSDELSKRAIDLGLTEDEIGQFDSDEELEKTVKIIESVVKEEDAVEKVDSTQTPDKKKTEEDAGIKFENEGDIDAELLKGIRTLEQQNKELRETVGKLAANVQQEQQTRQQEQQKQFVKRFDGMVDKLGLDFADVFGKGSLDDLSMRSKAYKNRDAVRGRMYALGMGFQVAKETVPDEQKLFDLAINSLHGEKVKIVDGLRLGKKTTKHSKSARVGRAATKKTGKLTGDQKAIKTNLEFDQLIDTSED